MRNWIFSSGKILTNGFSMDDIVVRATALLRQDLRGVPDFELGQVIEELIDTLEDERRDCRILEAIINDLRAAEEWVNGKSE